ncbi:TPA: hypothetical protein NO423_004105 [Salmonella enterica subsp. enterica serovar Infantis]|nr:hypothetical protein [Salmonella enterica subsp. enterica serovar Infantis]HCI4149841.1 hypothetical protein [Salmonella enterica subsp. enterica serovar Infantis]
MTTLTYSIGYAIRNINTVMSKGWPGYTLLGEIECEAKRLNVDEKEILRHYAITKMSSEGSNFSQALSVTKEMSIEELRTFLA